MSAFILKIIAIISMTCDHFSDAVLGKFTPLNYIGRIAFPIFAFQITEGYIHTSNLKKYLFRLLVFALVSQIPFHLFLSVFSAKKSLNIFFTLLIGLLAITFYDKLDNLPSKNNILHYFYKFIGILAVILLSLFAEILHTDYGYFGVLLIFLFFLFKSNKVFMNISVSILVFIFYFKYLIIPYFTIKYIYIIFFTLLSLIFINAYNNEKGKNIKYLLYFYYPIHLIVFYALHFILQ